MNEEEELVVHYLACAWNHFVTLPVEHPQDEPEFLHAIHAAQNIVLSRLGRRSINANSN